ncbi:MAG: hypothetical protein ACYCUD_03710 [Candidatus Dormibacteria bacterium]
MGKLGRTIQVGLLVGAALALSMAPVLAQVQSVSGSLSGFEDAVPLSTCSVSTSTGSPSCQTASFAGYFSATKYRDSGFWNATVEHEGLPLSSGTTTPIVGGAFTLDMLSGQVVKGSLGTGTIAYGSPSGSWFGCTQTFTVEDSLAATSVNFSGGQFKAYLTHYGTSESGGSCTGIYFATISGELTLNF